MTQHQMATATCGLTCHSDVCGAGLDHLPLPWGAMEHVFPQGKLLPFLTHLCIEAASSISEAVSEKREGEYQYGFMAADGLPAVFAACPALVSLSIRNALEPGDLTPLLQLPATVKSFEVRPWEVSGVASAIASALEHACEEPSSMA